MKNICFIFTLCTLLLACGSSQCKKPTSGVAENTAAVNDTITVKRFAGITGLKPEKEKYYKELHAAVWPAVLKKIKESNIRNYSIYLKEIEGKPYLFSYFEYTGNNFEEDMRKMAADSATQRWWKETDPTQIPLPDAAAKNEIWSGMDEVFHTN